MLEAGADPGAGPGGAVAGCCHVDRCSARSPDQSDILGSVIYTLRVDGWRGVTSGVNVMRRDDVLALLEAHRDELQRFHIKSLALFGSVARDEAGPDSDIDVLVEFEGRATFERYTDLKFFLEDVLQMRVDLVMRSAVRPRLLPYVEQDMLHVA